MAEYFWFFVIVIGPLLFAGALAYGLLRRRRLTQRERAAQHRKVEELYGDGRE